ncbi:hypothetical protein PLESTM_001426800, partial [Pleodorina starrii]
VEEDLARTSTAHKGSYGSGIGEERTALLPVMFGLAEYCAAMRAGGCPQPLSLRRRTHTHPHPGDKGDKEQEGQWVATVLPSGPVGLLLPGFRGEVWMEPGQPPSQGQVLATRFPVVALDVLHKHITDDEVVVVKTNPVNDYIGPLLRKQVQRPPSGVDGGSGRAFSPLVEAGFLEFVYGGREVGAGVDGRTPLSSTKRITAELGNVTPYIVVPGGDWTADDIEYHASSLATALAHNAGHNCNGMEILLTDREWPLRPVLMAALKAKLAALPPGSRGTREPGKKYDRFMARFPSASGWAVPSPPRVPVCPVVVPWLVAEGLSLDEGQLQNENWCGVVQEVALPGCGGDPRALHARRRPHRQHPHLRLSGGGSGRPPARGRPPTPPAWDDFIASLRYGGVAVNAPLLFLFGQPALSWGAFPGNTPHDIGSGVGAVHNTLLFDHPQKSVLYAPGATTPAPFGWWTTGRWGRAGCCPQS